MKPRFLLASCLALLLFLGMTAPLLAQLRGIRVGLGPEPMLGLPPVFVPKQNPQSPQKIELGKLLFFDPRLSRDSTISCATCHQPQKFFADGHRVAVGIRGQLGSRNTPSILNVGYNYSQFWDGRARDLEAQALMPIANPLEMGFSVQEAVRRLNGIRGYQQRFQQVFGTPVTAQGLSQSVASFERTLLSGNAPWDEYSFGLTNPLSKSALRGIELFNHKGRCSLCHMGPTFTDNIFHNLGVGMDQPHPDLGHFVVTHLPKDIGAFKTPSLRNVALTAPYMHDGSLKTLKDVVEFYDKGATPNPHQDARMFPRHFTDQERADLEAFLRSLSGESPPIKPPVLPR